MSHADRVMGSKANNNKLQNIRKQDILHNNGCGDVFSSHFLKINYAYFLRKQR